MYPLLIILCPHNHHSATVKYSIATCINLKNLKICWAKKSAAPKKLVWYHLYKKLNTEQAYISFAKTDIWCWNTQMCVKTSTKFPFTVSGRPEIAQRSLLFVSVSFYFSEAWSEATWPVLNLRPLYPSVLQYIYNTLH